MKESKFIEYYLLFHFSDFLPPPNISQMPKYQKNLSEHSVVPGKISPFSERPHFPYCISFNISVSIYLFYCPFHKRYDFPFMHSHQLNVFIWKVPGYQMAPRVNEEHSTKQEVIAFDAQMASFEYITFTDRIRPALAKCAYKTLVVKSSA